VVYQPTHYQVGASGGLHTTPRYAPNNTVAIAVDTAPGGIIGHEFGQHNPAATIGGAVLGGVIANRLSR